MQAYFNDLKIKIHEVIDSKENGQIKEFDLTHYNINELRVLKSYESHKTELYLELKLLTIDQLNIITSGGCSISITITSGYIHEKDNTDTTNLSSSSNVFKIEEMGKIETKRIGGNNLYSVNLRLISWTLGRMLLENNFGFTSQTSLKYGKSNPRIFLLGHIEQIFLETYTNYGSKVSPKMGTEGYGDYIENSDELSSNSTHLIYMNDSSTDLKTISTSIPTSGYVFKSDNNFKILEEFFKNYPPYLTPFNWIQDDLPLNSKNSTELIVTDFYIPRSWEEDKFLTPLIRPRHQTYLDEARYFKISKIEDRPYFDKLKFESNSKDPLIQLVQTSDNVPTIIDSTSINKITEKYISCGDHLQVKQIPNPKVKRIYSFLSENDLIKQLSYFRKYYEMNPNYETYEVDNIAWGHLDIKKALFKDKFISEDNTVIENARKGPAYRIEWVFTPTVVETISFFESETNNEDNQKTFKCKAKIEFLMTENVEPQDTNILLDISKQISKLKNNIIETINPSTGSVSINGVIYGAGSPYNGQLNIKGTSNDIAKTAEALIKKGFRYLWGGAESGWYDCSGFVMTSVCLATGLKKYGGRMSKDAFPKGSQAQADWCRRYASPIDYDEVQAGDIIFLSTTADINRVHHVGIAKSQTEVMASSSRVTPYRPASSCTKSNPCKGASIEKRYTTGKGGNRVAYWDKQFAGAFRIEGNGSSKTLDKISAGVYCAEIAKVESTGLAGNVPEGYEAINPTTGARGAYQFLDGTANEYAKKIGLDPNSPEIWTPENQDRMCAEREKYIIKYLNNHGLPANLRNVYMAWQQGAKGALDIIHASQSSDDGNVSSSREKNMRANMHYYSYTGAKSYVKDLDRFLQAKGVDPEFNKV